MTDATDTGFPPISDYAFLSDCHSVALVGRDASVEWACFHRFDQRSVFARILDRERGGYFRIAPVAEYTTTRRYLPDTNVLETRFETATGAVTVTDCLPVRETSPVPAASSADPRTGCSCAPCAARQAPWNCGWSSLPDSSTGSPLPSSNTRTRTWPWSPVAPTPCSCRANWGR
ncbi:trehalase-like domain-containing protein [Streptomyces sp. RKAG293]|uniref:trehalase-like domain-containing protein n=1 Tax=Streptomyces sp. RKAG293 TaxID=2893403 RepID=UPI0020338126|nr:trehalase-like domain-containing protein [Streptomyces sp. RKAG293]MCM2416845.1 DUF5911 domain-containing protein [Streptomyces sp. RKAG293]